jgi:hypothetical protein
LQIGQQDFHLLFSRAIVVPAQLIKAQPELGETRLTPQKEWKLKLQSVKALKADLRALIDNDFVLDVTLLPSGTRAMRQPLFRIGAIQTP